MPDYMREEYPPFIDLNRWEARQRAVQIQRQGFVVVMVDL